MMRPVMVLASLRSAVRGRRFAWLLALALWLPMAQWAAAAHGFTHLQAGSIAAGEAPDQPAHLPGSCDLCLVAAALGSAAPGNASTPTVPIAASAVHAVWHDVPAAATRPALAYLSRAPPASR